MTTPTGSPGQTPGRTPGHTDLADRIVACDDLPYGRERTLLAERLVDEADAAGDTALGVAARHVLIPSYNYGPAAEPQKIFSAFAWNLARWDEDATAFSPVDRHYLLWYFKWVTTNLLRYPQVPFAQVERALADMRERYEGAGEGLAPYWGSAYLQARHRYGDHDPRTKDAYEQWISLPRTSLSDCLACEPEVRAARLVALGDDEEAVATALPVLERGGCREQPHGVADEVVGSLVRTGRMHQAAFEHSRATRLHRRDGEHADLEAQIRVSTLVGRHGRALDLLEDVLHTVTTSPVPWNRMLLAACGARLMTALVESGHGDEPVAAALPDTRWSTPRPAAALGGELRDEALALAAAFDERNGTSAVGALVRSRLAAPDLPDVPEWARTHRSRLDRRPAAAPVVVEAPAAATLPGRLDAVVGLLDEVTVSGAAQGWERLVERWSALRPLIVGRDPRLAQDRMTDIARLDVAAVRHDLAKVPDGERPDAALAARLEDAGASLGMSGDAAGGLLVTMQAHTVESLARAAEDPRSVSASLREAADIVSAVTATGDQVATAQVKAEEALLAVRLGQTVTDPAVAQAAHDAGQRAAAAATALFEKVDPQDLTGTARGRYALVLMLRTQDLEHPAALDLLERALGSLLPPGVRAHERAVLLDAAALRLANLDRVEETVATLDAAADEARTAGLDALALTCDARSGGLLLDLGRPDDAAERLERVVDARGPAASWSLTADLTLALTRAGRSLDAADLAETTARLLAAQGPTGEDPQAAFDAGRAAFVGALALRALDESDAAARLAGLSARLHGLHPQVLARAEALDLQASCTDDAPARVRLLTEALEAAAAGDDPWFTADLRRRHADAVDDADGPDAALALLAALAADVTAMDADAEHEGARRWHLAAVRHLETALLWRAERVGAALERSVGVAEGYREVGDLENAVRATCLQAEVMDGAGRTADALALLRATAETALGTGEAAQARSAGAVLARMLDRHGDPQAAADAWDRYSGDPVE